MSIPRNALPSIDFSDVVAGPRLLPVKPGDILLHDFLEPLGMSTSALAEALKVPPNRIKAVLRGSCSVTADTALRLARYFGGSPHFWLNLQQQYDLEVAEYNSGARIAREVSPRQAAALALARL